MGLRDLAVGTRGKVVVNNSEAMGSSRVARANVADLGGGIKV